MQYNKRDLLNQDIPLLTRERLEKDLNAQLRVPAFDASATVGPNVVETLKKIIMLTMISLQKELR